VRLLYPLLIAIQFLTRLPVQLRHLPDDRQIGRSLLYYPLVGLLLGACLAGVHVALLNLAVSNMLRAALEVSIWVLLTGALHLDGLADTVDAWAGGRGNRQRTLEIMKDPTSGPMGVTALALILLIKFAVLNNLFMQQWYLLLLIPFAARGALVWLMVSVPYVRRGGLGEALAQHAPKRGAKVILVLFAMGAVAIYKIPATIILSTTVLVYLFFRNTIHRRIGGTTGDTAGALVEIVETLALIIVSIALPLLERWV